MKSAPHIRCRGEIFIENSEYKGVDICKGCDVLENPRNYDIESEYHFTCSDCTCYGCPDLHNCTGKCVENKDRFEENK